MASPEKYLTCKKIVELLAETATTYYGCPSGRMRREPTTLAICELHGKVTPLAENNREGYRSCYGCESFQQG